ncbi:MAG TPA: SusD/RagB family nutrient-binding outer membrane lipoprotein, partial [Bryobacteraceae bacterium]
ANPAGAYAGNELGSVNNLTGNASSSMGPGILKSVSQPAVMITASESFFLQAEANLRGWIGAAGDDVNNFNSGVTASFEYLGAATSGQTPDQTAAAYVAQSGNKQTNYSACTTFDEKLACIIRQKWLAMNSITPFEAWSDYRRLGLPADIPISVSLYRDGPNIPVRILYPTSEYTTNAANVGAEGTIDGHTSKIFWMP